MRATCVRYQGKESPRSKSRKLETVGGQPVELERDLLHLLRMKMEAKRKKSMIMTVMMTDDDEGSASESDDSNAAEKGRGDFWFR